MKNIINQIQLTEIEKDYLSFFKNIFSSRKIKI
jgi:hypothetical protein